MRRSWPTKGCCAVGRKVYQCFGVSSFVYVYGRRANMDRADSCKTLIHGATCQKTAMLKLAVVKNLK
jgi:hypothetical protein